MSSHLPGPSKKLVTNAVLLTLIDPVRGAPTRDFLDGYLDEDTLTAAQLKQKFLDSFALICSTSGKGKETASAVCFEQIESSVPVLRVARNRGLPHCVLAQLERVIQLLAAVAEGSKTSSQTESELLVEIANLDQDRIEHLSKKLLHAKIRQAMETAITNSTTSDWKKQENEGELNFKLWIQTCPFDDRDPLGPRASSCIQWAADARWTYHQQIQRLFGFLSASPPLWILTLHKLARYKAAIKSMVKLAIKQPTICTSLCIKAVEAPPQKKFCPPTEKDFLQNTLKRLLKQDSDQAMYRLAKRWRTDDQEKTMRRACHLTLTLHAEMQLLEFYDRNPTLAPTFKWMGTSKKACYLCYGFLLKHHLHIRVLACHQKVYPTWLPPSYDDLPGVKRWGYWCGFSNAIERETVNELRSDLSTPKRPMNCDSTAGPSLTTTATVSSLV